MGIVVLMAAAVVAATPGTLRVDFFHTGSATEELLPLDGLAIEGAGPGR
ncbi:MAG: hypothetical protein U0V87_02505 [Acidobacteriota bacterium]